MTIEEVQEELEMAGVPRVQQIKLISFCQSNGYNAKELDRKLSTMGIDPIFSIYEDDSEDSDSNSK
jgi:hypothetical protein